MFFVLYACIKLGTWAVMYMSVLGILACFCDFRRIFNYSDGVTCFIFHFMLSTTSYWRGIFIVYRGTHGFDCLINQFSSAYDHWSVLDPSSCYKVVQKRAAVFLQVLQFSSTNSTNTSQLHHNYIAETHESDVHHHKNILCRILHICQTTSSISDLSRF